MDLLEKLPRVTREIFTILLEYGELDESHQTKSYKINCDVFNRRCTYPEKDGDIRILKELEILDLIEPDEYLESSKYSIDEFGESDFLLTNIINFARKNNIKL